MKSLSPYRRPSVPEIGPPPPWQKCATDAHARVDAIRGLVRYGGRLLAGHPEIPLELVPWPWSPTSIGALLTLWDRSPWFGGSCPECDSTSRGWSAVGLGQRGSVNGVCLACGTSLIRQSPLPMQTHAADVLEGSGFALSQRHCWGWVMGAPSRELAHFLQLLRRGETGDDG